MKHASKRGQAIGGKPSRAARHSDRIAALGAALLGMGADVEGRRVLSPGRYPPLDPFCRR